MVSQDVDFGLFILPNLVLFLITCDCDFSCIRDELLIVLQSAALPLPPSSSGLPDLTRLAVRTVFSLLDQVLFAY